MRHGSLFSGIGGFDLAAEWMGWTNIFHCEWAEFQRKILDYHFPNAISYDNIKTTDFTPHRGQIDVLTGGFPCQPFSLAGKRKGADDDRYLWDEMLRAIREIQPTWIVGENVAGLLSMVQPGETLRVEEQADLFGENIKNIRTVRQEYVIETICRDLEREGYSVQPLVVPACAVGAPHRRDRLWIIAKNTDDIRRNSEERKSVTEARQQWKPCARDHERVCLSKETPTNTDNIHRDKGWTASGGVTEDSTKRSRILIDTERLGSVGVVTHTEGVAVNPERKRWGEVSDDNGKPKKAQQEECGQKQPCGADSSQGRWRDFPTQPPVCGRDDGISDRLDGITFPKLRSKSIEGYGNAVVPQVVYQIFKAIEQVEYGRGKNNPHQ